MSVSLSHLVVAERQVAGQSEILQLGLVVEGVQPQRSLFVGLRSGQGVFGMHDGLTYGALIAGLPKDRGMSCMTKGREHRISSRDRQPTRDVIGGQRVDQPGHVAVKATGVRPDPELDRRIAGHGGQACCAIEMSLRGIEPATIDGSPHRTRRERRRAPVERASDALTRSPPCLQCEGLAASADAWVSVVSFPPY